MESINLQIKEDRPTVGIYSLSSCGGCQLQILNLNLDLLSLIEQVNIVYWPMTSSLDETYEVDIAIVEGAVKTDDDKKKIRDIREKASKVIALGACACGLGKECDGGFEPISSLIDVDYFVRCCPIDPENFIDVLQKAIGGRNTFLSTGTLCGECKNNETTCFFAKNQLCAGLVSRSGCDAICTRLGKPCLGCSGISPNAVFETAYANARGIHQNFLDEYYDDFLATCSVARFLNQDISDLSSKDASFVASRSNANVSINACLDVIEEEEAIQNVVLDDRTKAMRRSMRAAERAQGHLSTLIFGELEKIKGFSNLEEFAIAEPNFINDALIYRSSLTRVLTTFGGRAVCPITPKVGGFSYDVDDDEIFDVRENLNDSIEFAKSLIDIISKVWEESNKCDHEILARVMKKWDDLTDVARFGAAKAGLRPPVKDPKKTCVAMAVEMVDDTQRIVDWLSN